MISSGKIRYYRLESQMTQEQLAERAQLSPSYISQIESEYRSAGKVAAKKIAKALDVPISELLEDSTASSEIELREYQIKKVLEDCTPQEFNISYKNLLSQKQIMRVNATNIS